MGNKEKNITTLYSEYSYIQDILYSKFSHSKFSVFKIFLFKLFSIHNFPIQNFLYSNFSIQNFLIQNFLYSKFSILNFLCSKLSHSKFSLFKIFSIFIYFKLRWNYGKKYWHFIFRIHTYIAEQLWNKLFVCYKNI